MRTKLASKSSRPNRLQTLDPPPDDEGKRENQAVRRGFSWLAVGNIVNAACAWGRVALLARLGNAEMIGQLTLALAVCNPIGTLADLGLSGSLISDANRQYRLRDYLGLRLLTCGLAMLVILVTAWTGGYDPATARLVVLAGLVVISESVCDLFQAVLQRREQMRWVAISLMIRGLLGLTFFALGTWFSGDLAWGVCGFSLAALTTLLGIDIPRALACERRQDASAMQGVVEPSEAKLKLLVVGLTAVLDLTPYDLSDVLVTPSGFRASWPGLAQPATGLGNGQPEPHDVNPPILDQQPPGERGPGWICRGRQPDGRDIVGRGGHEPGGQPSPGTLSCCRKHGCTAAAAPRPGALVGRRNDYLAAGHGSRRPMDYRLAFRAGLRSACRRGPLPDVGCRLAQFQHFPRPGHCPPCGDSAPACCSAPWASWCSCFCCPAGSTGWG